MKALRYLCIILGIFIYNHPAQAQTESPTFLAPGNTFLGPTQFLTARTYRALEDGMALTEVSSVFTRLNWNKGLSSRWGLGGELYFRASAVTSDFGRSNSESYGGWLNASYGFQIKGQQLISMAQVGYQRSSTNHYSGSLKLAYPVVLKNSNIFLMPSVGYRYMLVDRFSGNSHSRSILLAVDLFTSVPKGQWWSGEASLVDTEQRYTKGSQIWGSNSRMEVEFNYNHNDLEDRDDLNTKHRSFYLSANYFYYLLDGMAVGAEVGLNFSVSPDNDLRARSTGQSYSLLPYLRWHPLNGGWLGNVYLEGGAGLSYSKSKSEFGSSESTSLTAEGGLGVMLALARSVYLNPSLRYRWRTWLNLDDDEESLKTKNLQLSVALNYTF